MIIVVIAIVHTFVRLCQCQCHFNYVFIWNVSVFAKYFSLLYKWTILFLKNSRNSKTKDAITCTAFTMIRKFTIITHRVPPRSQICLRNMKQHNKICTSNTSTRIYESPIKSHVTNCKIKVHLPHIAQNTMIFQINTHSTITQRNNGHSDNLFNAVGFICGGGDGLSVRQPASQRQPAQFNQFTEPWWTQSVRVGPTITNPLICVGSRAFSEARTNGQIKIRNPRVAYVY